MIKLWILAAALASALPAAFAATPQAVAPLELADRVLRRGLAVSDLGLYPGTLLMQGMSELALLNPDQRLLKETIGLFEKFTTQEIKGRGSFFSYEAGGSGAAYLHLRGVAPTLGAQVRKAAQQMQTEQKRSSEGLLMPPWIVAEKDQVFIDPAFAVTPFLLYAGLQEQRKEYIDLAIFETMELFRILHDKTTGLLHQGRGFKTKDVLSEDNWSRGNGWGALGLATLVRDLPPDHPRRPEIEALARRFFEAVLKLQNAEGLWHQEMTDPTSYVETSGSALLLYGLGVMLEKHVIDQTYLANFQRGLANITAYIAADGSVSHTCIGCLCPGEGRKADYKQRRWAYNDPHGFGAIVLACVQAAKLGIRELHPTLEPGILADPADAPGKPMAYVQFIPEGTHVAWENDRIAFRVFGPAVRQKVGSGIDVWTKSVDYPVVAKWYRLNSKGLDYHVERGEGCDFYHAGRLSGAGGLSVWQNGKPFAPATFSEHHIERNEPDGIAFTLEFEPWDAGGRKVSERRTIRMIPGTNFFAVQSTLRAESDDELTVAIGVTTFGKPKLVEDKARGLLAAWEQIDPKHGAMGTAVVAEPQRVVGFTSNGQDRFIQLRVKPNEPFSYYVAVGWSGNPHFSNPELWDRLLAEESSWSKLNELYGAQSRSAATVSHTATP